MQQTEPPNPPATMANRSDSYPPRPATPSPADSASVSERRPSFHDQRHGREDEGHERFGPGGDRPDHRKQASLAFATDGDEGHGTTDKQPRPWSRYRADLSSLSQKLLAHRWFKWIRPKLTWGQLKPVVRTAISSWIGLVLLLIVPVERALGYGAFFLLIVGFMIPPHEPIVQTLEKYLYLFFFAGVAWIWVILAVLIAGATRDAPNAYKVAAAEAKWAHLKQSDPVKYAQRVIFEAPYLQAKPAVVYAIFLATGTGALVRPYVPTPLTLQLWWKLQTQPNPATFPLVLSCILIDISLTTAVFYPSNTYTSGLIFFLPMAVQAGIGALCSVVIFPESVGHSFQSKLLGILAPLVSAMESIDVLFAGVERGVVKRAERADHSVDHSHDHSVDPSPNPSLDPSLHHSLSHRSLRSLSSLSSWTRQSKAIRATLLQSLAGLAPLRAQQRYLAVDIRYSRLSGEDLRNLFDGLAVVQARSGGLAFFFDVVATNTEHSHLDSSAWAVEQVSRPASVRMPAPDTPTPDTPALDTPTLDVQPSATPRRTHLAGRWSGSSHALAALSALAALHLDPPKTPQPVGVDTETALAQLATLAAVCRPVVRSSQAVLSAATRWILGANRAPTEASARALADATAELHDALDAFRRSRRATIQPYRHLFDPSHPAEPPRVSPRPRSRLTRRSTPAACSNTLSPTTTSSNAPDADADDDTFDVLGDATQRDPEVRPFDRPALNVLARVVRPLDVFRSRGFLYALKAGVLGALTTLPNFVAAQLSGYGCGCSLLTTAALAVYSVCLVPPTLLTRRRATRPRPGSDASSRPSGAASPAWPSGESPPSGARSHPRYIGSGSSSGNPSYYNGTLGPLTYAQWGWDVAWRRFLCVLIGITAAWLFAYIPPVFSAKRAVRRSYAQAIGVAGNILCDVLSDANDPHDRLRENDAVRKHLVAWRSKLNRLGSRHVNATREVSLRGQWPEERYEALLETLQDTFSLLSQLHHVLVQLDRPWRRALLARTRLSDPLFLGDVLVVLSVCSTALRTGTALPQITPSPLLARFRMGKTKGLDIPLGVVDGIPSRVTVDVLESDEYMRYALGITTTFSLVSRLDRMVAVGRELSYSRASARAGLGGVVGGVGGVGGVGVDSVGW
ncbi:uncharacterized protein L203_105612 [Cryptococcus depauperatus CBS 7841]|uniref:ER transporter 6TM N-terminal domain-containing protein n=1 Tax=Cryptococcus depauperatus CBS 7841 TaxID=1295531 RepID=A0AAJ8M483_9TREE